VEDARGVVELQHASRHQHGDPVGERLRLAAVVGHEDRGDTILTQDDPELRQQRGPCWRVEPRERLVEQQQLRLEHERPRQRHALRLASRELPRPLIPEGRDVEALEPPLDARPVRVVAEAAEPQSQRDVLGDGHVGQERALEHRRHPPPLGQRVPRIHRAIVNPHDAPRGTLEQPDDA